MAGRPTGAWSDKKFRDALNVAVSEKGPKGHRKIRIIAEKLVEAAMAGEIGAIREVADRIDGKPAQALTVDQTVTHDFSRLSDAELAAIIAEEDGRARGAKAQGNKAGLH